MRALTLKDKCDSNSIHSISQNFKLQNHVGIEVKGSHKCEYKLSVRIASRGLVGIAAVQLCIECKSGGLVCEDDG